MYASRDFLRACYLRSAGLEADVTLTRHLRTQPHWCWTERSTPRALVLAEGVHPLMEQASPLTVGLEGADYWRAADARPASA